MIVSGFVQAQNVNANLITNDPVSCNLNGYTTFELVPINPAYIILDIQLTEFNGSSNTSSISFPYEDQDGTSN
jgi:hypothetical protein